MLQISNLGHIVQKAKPKKKEGKQPSYEASRKLPQKQPANEQNPDMHQTDFGLKAMKTDG